LIVIECFRSTIDVVPVVDILIRVRNVFEVTTIIVVCNKPFKYYIRNFYLPFLKDTYILLIV